MRKVVKKKGKIIQAYQLGKNHPVLERLMKENKVKDRKDGTYEVFSQEAIRGESGRGQLAAAGDWIRLDGTGSPYPCQDSWFQENLRHIRGDDYEQIPKPVDAWTAEEAASPEIRFLIREKGLRLNPADPDHYFQAVLWGTPEAAARDAVLIFYSITRDEAGNILDADFNFVAREEFDREYTVLS